MNQPDKGEQQSTGAAFAQNKADLDQQKAAFKTQLQQARDGQQTREQVPDKTANENKQQAGQSKEAGTDKGKESFKAQLQQARGSDNQRQLINEARDNSSDITGGKQQDNGGNFKGNAEEVTGKKQQARKKPGKLTPQLKPDKGFTRTWGIDRD